MTRAVLPLAVALLASAFAVQSASAACIHPDDRDSAGRRCGKRAASERPGGLVPGAGNALGNLPAVGLGYPGLAASPSGSGARALPPPPASDRCQVVLRHLDEWSKDPSMASAIRACGLEPR